MMTKIKTTAPEIGTIARTTDTTTPWGPDMTAAFLPEVRTLAPAGVDFDAALALADEQPGTDSPGFPTPPDHTVNPYLLESSRILGDLAHEANRAQAVIHQLDAEMTHISNDAAFQINRITARRDTELAARQARIDDLMRIVAANTIVNGDKQESGE